MLGLGLGVLGLVVVSMSSSEMLVCLGLVGALALKPWDFLTAESGFLLFMDNLSFSLVVLTYWVVCLALLASSSILEGDKTVSIFNSLMLLLTGALLVSFFSESLLGFYLGFEMSLLPIFFVILGWGGQPERIEAGVYLLFYTIFGSLPLLAYLFMLNNSEGGAYFSSLQENYILGAGAVVVLSGAFLVKYPVYGAHLWLLKAHVEAPVAGSMLLAGVLLKLGGYGLIRVSEHWGAISFVSASIIISLSMVGAGWLALECVTTTDVKILIAASSVVHMSMCVCAVYLKQESIIQGAILMMVAHGVCSSGLFFLADSLYKRSSSRSLWMLGGSSSGLPGMTLWWALLCSVNIAAPPSLNLLSEITLLVSLISSSAFLILPVSACLFFSGAYNIYMYSASQHSSLGKQVSAMNPGSLREHFIGVLHWLPVNLLILAVFIMV